MKFVRINNNSNYYKNWIEISGNNSSIATDHNSCFLEGSTIDDLIVKFHNQISTIEIKEKENFIISHYQFLYEVKEGTIINEKYNITTLKAKHLKSLEINEKRKYKINNLLKTIQ